MNIDAVRVEPIDEFNSEPRTILTVEAFDPNNNNSSNPSDYLRQSERQDYASMSGVRSRNRQRHQ